MPKYRIIPKLDTADWTAAHPEMFPLLDTEKQAWEFYFHNKDVFNEHGIDEVMLQQID